MDNLNFGSDTVTINGREKHVISYFQDFLFPPQRIRSPVSSLSGGERNRLLLARLFTQPANLLVSHDRVFLDNVVTRTLVFEGRGTVNDYVGGYDDTGYASDNNLVHKLRLKKIKPKQKKNQ